jgi:hypothetical protein
MDKDDPMRRKLRKESELPSRMKSSTEMEDPKTAMPYTDKDEPNREKLLIDKEEPMWMKSNKDIDDPRVHIP